MNISTRGRYGLRAVLDLAANYGDKPVTLSAIAARHWLPALARIIKSIVSVWIIAAVPLSGQRSRRLSVRYWTSTLFMI